MKPTADKIDKYPVDQKEIQKIPNDEQADQCAMEIKVISRSIKINSC